MVGSAPQERCALIPLLCSAWAGSHPEPLGRVRTLCWEAKTVHSEGKATGDQKEQRAPKSALWGKASGAASQRRDKGMVHER